MKTLIQGSPVNVFLKPGFTDDQGNTGPSRTCIQFQVTRHLQNGGTRLDYQDVTAPAAFKTEFDKYLNKEIRFPVNMSTMNKTIYFTCDKNMTYNEIEPVAATTKATVKSPI